MKNKIHPSAPISLHLIMALIIFSSSSLSSSLFSQENKPEENTVLSQPIPELTSLGILPPDDFPVEYDHYKVRWLAEGKGNVWKEIAVKNGQMIRLDLIPGSYLMQMELISLDQVVASSEFGNCQLLSKSILLNMAEQAIQIPVCSLKGDFSISENKVMEKSEPSDFLPPPTAGAKSLDKGLKENDIENSLSILVFGDSGTGTKDQYKVAEGMKGLCATENCQFALMLGDNFYQTGVTNLDDRQFISKFEKPYGGLAIPFYVVLGNHDTYSGSKGVMAQIGHSKRSSIWNMPGRYYQFSKGDADFFAIDSNTIRDDKKQRDWLINGLNQSNARWKIVFAHHPIYSVGSHGFFDWIEGGGMSKLRKLLGPILCRNGADMYLTGHDHHLEIDHASCGVVHVLSGASAKIREVYSKLKKDWKVIHKFSRGKKLGFTHLRLFPNHGVVKMLDSSGKVIFEYEFKNRD